MLRRLCLITGFLVLSGCGDPALVPLTACETVGVVEPICRFHNPEDLELLPDQHTLLVSQMGNMEGTKTGNLVYYNTLTETITPAFPLPVKVVFDTALNWGTGDCPGAPETEFSPHGTSLKQRTDGRWQLAVINHGKRESVEMFEVISSVNGYALEWRGCVVPPDGTYMNDVALKRDGGFVASHMFDKHSPIIFGMSTGIWKSQLGIDTGYVFEWTSGAANNGSYHILEESHGPFINGVEISADDSTVFANVYAGNEIRKLDRISGKQLGSAPAIQVDNIAWDAEGYLLGGSHTGSPLDQMDCIKHPGETCGFEFTIVRIDPETMSMENIFRHAGAPMGAATTARQVGDKLYIGTFSGNRMIRIPYLSSK